MGIKCFLLEPVAKIRVWARRYSKGVPNCCPKNPGEYSYHQAMNLIGDFDFPVPAQGWWEDWIGQEEFDRHLIKRPEIAISEDAFNRATAFTETLRPPIGDPRWPAKCECGATFENSNVIERGGQMFVHRLQKRSDTGDLVTVHDAPAGAMWRAWWMQHEGRYWDWDNQNEPPLMCKTPGGEWNIDGRATNYTLKNDRLHRCWVRHGVPPQITVDKNGLTCGAGAGSILSGKYHGFLRNGELVAA